MTENVKDLFTIFLEFLSANFISSKENSTIEGKVTFEQSPPLQYLLHLLQIQMQLLRSM